MLEFRILGPLEVRGEDGPVRLGGPKQRATLAILLLNANRVVSVDRLADDLYAGAPPVTAVTQVQRQISELRKTLGTASAVETRPPGYLIRVSADQLDLNRFERATGDAAGAFASGDYERASGLLREALDLWRGTPLADLTYEPFAQPAIERLAEIQLAALERRIESELALGRHAALVGELQQLAVEHPLREQFSAQLMLALYRSGRQAEALDTYRRTRETLVEELGIEPSRALQELERAILTHDPSLELERRSPSEPERSILVLPSTDDGLDAILQVAEPLGRLPGRELIIARLLVDPRELAHAASELNSRCAGLGRDARAAAFTTLEPTRDAVRLASAYDVDLVLLEAPPALAAEPVPDDLGAIFERAPADVAVLAGSVDLVEGDGFYVPFGGNEHDWAALELAAWLASAVAAPLRLVGASATARGGRRDASRLLADASLAVQRVVGVQAQPLLVEPNEEALAAAVEPATLVVVGVSPRWRRDGIGTARRALVRRGRPPTLVVHRGARPGGLAPAQSRTRFTWTLAAAAV